MLSDKDKQLFIKAVNIRATMFDEHKRIMTFTQFEQALKEKKEYETCKNCKKYTPHSDAGLEMISDQWRITECDREHPDWGCKDFTNVS